jgi:uncharacterized protein YdaT
MVDNVDNNTELTLNQKLNVTIENIENTEQGKIDLDGVLYTKVSKRVSEFRKTFGFDCSIITKMLHIDEESVVARANIGFWKEGKFIIIATGHAEENRDSNSINKYSALENAETSAIGRALSNLGLAGGEFASANEVISVKTKAQKEKTSGVEVERKATEQQVEFIKELISETAADVTLFLKNYSISKIEEIKYEAANDAIKKLQTKKTKALKEIEIKKNKDKILFEEEQSKKHVESFGNTESTIAVKNTETLTNSSKSDIEKEEPTISKETATDVVKEKEVVKEDNVKIKSKTKPKPKTRSSKTTKKILKEEDVSLPDRPVQNKDIELGNMDEDIKI